MYTDYFNRQSGSTVAIRPDYCLINDWMGDRVVDAIDGDVAFPREKIIITIDHESPSGSIKVAQQQNKVIDWAEKESIMLLQNAGIGYEYIGNRVADSGDVVFSTGMYSSYLGAKGILAVQVTPEEMAAAIKGEAIKRNVPKKVELTFTGTLKNGVSIKDVFLSLNAREKSDRKGQMLLMNGKSLSDRDKVLASALSRRLGFSYGIFTDEELDGKTVDLSAFDSVVALPASDEVKKTDDLGSVRLQGIFIGGCLSGSIEDLRYVASRFKGKKCAKEVRVTIAPISDEVQIMAMEEGIVDAIFDAGAFFLSPGCGSCKATSFGYMDDGEVMLSAGAHNFSGAGGSEKSLVYLSSLETAVESALKGYIAKAE